MSLNNLKFSESSFTGKDIASLPDKPGSAGINATQLKARFDLLPKAVLALDGFNSLIEELQKPSVSAELGAFIPQMTENTVAAALGRLRTMLDDHYTKAEANSHNNSNSLLIKEVSLEPQTGIFSFVRKNDSVFTIDTAMEKLALDAKLDGTDFVLTLVDGTEQRVSLAAFVDVITFLNSEDIVFTHGTNSVGKTVTAVIKDASIGYSKLSPTAVSTLEGFAQDAENAFVGAAQEKTAAGVSAVAAKASELSAAGSAEAATVSAAAAKVSEGAMEDVVEAATVQATRARNEADRAKNEADRAQEIAGGDYATRIEVVLCKSESIEASKAYTDEKVAAIPVPDVAGAVAAHNTNADSHNLASLLATHAADSSSHKIATTISTHAADTASHGIAASISASVTAHNQNTASHNLANLMATHAADTTPHGIPAAIATHAADATSHGIATTLNTHNGSDTAHSSLFNQKVDKQEGLSLSAENYTTAEKAQVATISTKADASAIPTLLPNPFSLLFQGAATVSYNGSQEKVVSIPSPVKPATIVVGILGVHTAADAHFLADNSVGAQVAIMAAVAALPTAGGKLSLLEGEYIITAAAMISKANLHICGMGRGTLLTRSYNGTTAHAGVLHIAGSDVTVSNLTVDGKKAVYASTLNYGICCTSPSFIGTSVHDCLFIDNHVGVNNMSGYASIRNNIFRGSTIGTINRGLNCVMGGNTCNLNATGIRIDTCNNAVISGNSCTDNTIEGISVLSAHNCTITGNTCSNNAQVGIASAGNRVLIAGNACYQNLVGINATGLCCNIANNTCIRNNGNTGDYPAGSGTIISSGNNSLVSGNMILGKDAAVTGTGSISINNKF